MLRRPFLLGLTAVLATTLTGIAIQAAFDARKQSAPPHAAPAAAPVAIAPLPLAAVGGEDITAALTTWIEGIEREEAAVADLASRGAVRSDGGSSGPGVAPSSRGSCGDDWDCFRECTIDHESRSAGVYGAVSPDGVYRGAFQFLGSTWRSVSVNAGYGEWADTPVDQVPAEVQDAVARFLWEHSGNRPWGGRC